LNRPSLDFDSQGLCIVYSPFSLSVNVAGSNISLTAAVVVLTGLVGANFAQTLMNTFGFTDPIARGMATASRLFLHH
jgi:putative effector of murein hydrolase